MIYDTVHTEFVEVRFLERPLNALVIPAGIVRIQASAMEAGMTAVFKCDKELNSFRK